MPKYFYLIFTLLLFAPPFAKGADFSMVINEIAWMGTINSANDEWIELYNNTENFINLDGWILKSDDRTPEIKLTGTVPAKSFYLLERTDDKTIPGIMADLIYKGALGNNGENLKLYDASGILIDEVNCQDGWFGGDNATKQTMERISPSVSGNDSSNWQASVNPGGTPKTKNSSQLTEKAVEVKIPQTEEKLAEVGPPPTDSVGTVEVGTVEVKPQQLQQTEVGPPPIYQGGVVFNEILPSPEGPDEKEEWIEIFNENNLEINIAGWKIEDTAGKTTTYVFPEKTKILPKEFLILPRPESKITLNNDGDGLKLIQPDGKIIDEFNFEKAPLGKSYNRTSSGWVWSTILTPGETNIIPEKTKLTENSSPLAQPGEVEPPTAENFLEKETAAIGEKMEGQVNFSSVLLIALGLAIFSAILILILKKKIST